MSLMNRVLEKLRDLLKVPNPTQMDIWIFCECENLGLDGGNAVLDIPHIPLDLRGEKCLILSVKSETYMNQLTNEARAIGERDKKYVPNIHYACRFYNALYGIQLPMPVPAAED